MEILGLKYTITEMKNSVEGHNTQNKKKYLQSYI